MNYTFLLIVRCALGFCLLAFVAFSSLSVWAARKWKRSRTVLDPDWTPGVTILKPVSGIESPHAYANFASFCNQAYPNERVQLIFGCLNSDDSAIPLIKRLQTDFPQIRIDLVCSGIQAYRGPNLKVCNLLAMLPIAQFDLLVLCDSDMRVEPDYVRRVVSPFRPGASISCSKSLSTKGVGLVTCPYRGSRVESLPAVMEALGIGADFIPGALVSRAMEGVGFAFGSTIALPRDVLEQIGGFEAILHELADDFRLGEKTRAAGYEVVLSDYVVDDVLGAERFIGMWNRRLRWARTVRSCRPWGYAGLFVTNGTALGLLFWALMGFTSIGTGVFVAGLAVRLAATAAIGATCTSDRNLIKYLPLLPISDVLSLCLYLASYLGNRIIWRGETFKLLPGGKMEKVTQGP